MENLERNLFKEAKSFLIEKLEGKVENPEETLDKYLMPEKIEKELNNIYQGLFWHSTNKGNGVGYIVEIFDKDLKKLPEDLKDYQNVIKNYNEYEKVLKKFNEKGIDTEKRSIKILAKTIVDSARFINNFKDYKEFKSFVLNFINKKTSKFKYGLAFFIGSQVHGIGFALACDFLKEIGFKEFGKPDRHIREILSNLGFLKENSTDLDVVIKLDEIAEKCKVSPYALDKLLWLIGSGNFYHHDKLSFKNSTDKFTERLTNKYL